jgi:hypothetical protein
VTNCHPRQIVTPDKLSPQLIRKRNNVCSVPESVPKKTDDPPVSVPSSGTANGSDGCALGRKTNSATDNSHSKTAERLKRQHFEALEQLAKAINVPKPGRPVDRTIDAKGAAAYQRRLRQWQTDGRCLDDMLSDAEGGCLGLPANRAVEALLAKAAEVGRSTVNNRMATLTAWVKKRRQNLPDADASDAPLLDGPADGPLPLLAGQEPHA